MVTLNARRLGRSPERGDMSNSDQSSSFPMQVRVARQVHTEGDTDETVVPKWTKVGFDLCRCIDVTDITSSDTGRPIAHGEAF